MMRSLLVVVALVCVSAPAAAQILPGAMEPERHIYYPDLGLGPIDSEPVETDGDVATEEHLLRHRDTGLYRVLAFRFDATCACEITVITDPFYPVALSRLPGQPYPPLSLWLIKGRHRLIYAASKDDLWQYGLPNPE